MSQKDVPTYSWAEIAKHDSDTDCWVVLYDKVLDVTKFLNEHPGGLDPIKDLGGTDITNSFESIGHTSTATLKSKSFIIGRVDAASKPVVPSAAAPPPKWSETDPEVLKKYKDGGGVIPVWAIAAVIFLIIAVLYLLA